MSSGRFFQGLYFLELPQYYLLPIAKEKVGFLIMYAYAYAHTFLTIRKYALNYKYIYLIIYTYV